MSAQTEVAKLYSAIEDSARLLGVRCSRDKVEPVLSAYADALPGAVIAFRVATGERYTGDVDWRFTVPKDIDPYAVALANGLTPEQDHPVGGLLAGVARRCPVDSYGVDFGATGGFKKIYTFFPPEAMQSLETLTAVEGMPRSLSDNAGFFARHGLADKVNVFGIDYRHRSVNVYFGGLPESCLRPETIRSMLDELGLPAPSEGLLTLGARAFGMYASLGWESAAVERFCFAVMTPDAAALPVPIEPRIGGFLTAMNGGAADSRFVYYAAVSAGDKEHYKLQAYYNWQPRMLGQMLLSDA